MMIYGTMSSPMNCGNAVCLSVTVELSCSCDLDLDQITLIYELSLDIVSMYWHTRDNVSGSRLS